MLYATKVSYRGTCQNMLNIPDAENQAYPNVRNKVDVNQKQSSKGILAHSEKIFQKSFGHMFSVY